MYSLTSKCYSKTDHFFLLYCSLHSSGGIFSLLSVNINYFPLLSYLLGSGEEVMKKRLNSSQHVASTSQPHNILINNTTVKHQDEAVTPTEISQEIDTNTKPPKSSRHWWDYTTTTKKLSPKEVIMLTYLLMLASGSDTFQKVLKQHEWLRWENVTSQLVRYKYRLISLFSAVKIICKDGSLNDLIRLIDIPDLQFGFRNRHATRVHRVTAQLSEPCFLTCTNYYRYHLQNFAEDIE